MHDSESHRQLRAATASHPGCRVAYVEIHVDALNAIPLYQRVRCRDVSNGDNLLHVGDTEWEKTRGAELYVGYDCETQSVVYTKSVIPSFVDGRVSVQWLGTSIAMTTQVCLKNNMRDYTEWAGIAQRVVWCEVGSIPCAAFVFDIGVSDTTHRRSIPRKQSGWMLNTHRMNQKSFHVGQNSKQRCRPPHQAKTHRAAHLPPEILHNMDVAVPDGMAVL